MPKPFNTTNNAFNTIICSFMHYNNYKISFCANVRTCIH